MFWAKETIYTHPAPLGAVVVYLKVLSLEGYIKAEKDLPKIESGAWNLAHEEAGQLGTPCGGSQVGWRCAGCGGFRVMPGLVVSLRAPFLHRR